MNYNVIIDFKMNFCIAFCIKFKFELLDHDAYDTITQAENKLSQNMC